jgi:hypothetical protein
MFYYLLLMSLNPKNMNAKNTAIALGVGLVLAPFTGGYSLLYTGFHVAAANGIKAVQDAQDNNADSSAN